MTVSKKSEPSTESIKDEVAKNVAVEADKGYRGVVPDGPADEEYTLLSGPDGPPIHTETLRVIEAKENKNG